MIKLLQVALLSASPFFELRGGIPLGLALGLDPVDVYVIAVFFNFLAVPVIFFFLDNLHHSFIKNKYYSRFFNKYVLKNRNKLEKYMGTKAEFWALMLIVLIPIL